MIKIRVFKSLEIDPTLKLAGHDPGGVEPIKPLGKTLGELMLTSSGSRIVRANQTRTVPKRVIVVLVPRVDGTFTLIPRSGVQQTQSQGKN